MVLFRSLVYFLLLSASIVAYAVPIVLLGRLLDTLDITGRELLGYR